MSAMIMATFSVYDIMSNTAASDEDFEYYTDIHEHISYYDSVGLDMQGGLHFVAVFFPWADHPAP